MSDSSSIVIPGYPANNRVPGVFATIDPSLANTATVNQRSLILAQKFNTGTAQQGVAILSAGVGDAQISFGAGSIAAIAVERYRALDPTGELWVLPMPDPTGSGGLAVATITFTGTATANSTLPVYVDGNYIPCQINNGDTPTVIAAEVMADLNGFTTAGGNPLALNASAAIGVLTLTARNKGPLGNMSTILLSVGGTSSGQGQPGTTNVPGVTAVIVQPAGGSAAPVIANFLANLPPQPFDFICCPYNDNGTGSSLAAVQSYLSDQAGTWNWSVQLFGGAFTAFGGTLGARASWAENNNTQHIAAIGALGSPSPDWHWAVDFCAASAVSLRADPTIPIGGLSAGATLNVVAPPAADQDTFAERQTLLFDGMSTYKADHAGVVHVDRAITTLSLTTSGGPDNAYLNLNVPYQLMAYIRVLETMLGSNFNQVKLVADGSRIPPGSRMVTSQTILAAVLAQYQQIAVNGIPGAPAGLVQNPQAFAANAVAQNAGGGVVTMLLPVELGGQLIAIAMSIQFTQP